MTYKDFLEEQKLVRQVEIERFRKINGFSEEDEYISWKYGENIHYYQPGSKDFINIEI